MENKKAIDVSRELDKIKLWKLSEYMLGRTLCSTNILYYNGEATWKKCVYLLLRSCCEVSYISGRYGKGKKIYFLFSSHNSGRKDHTDIYKKIASTCRNRVELSFKKVNLKRVSLKSVFRLLSIPVWYYQINKLPISGRHKIFLLVNLLCALSERDAIERELICKECSMLVCYFDGAMAESLVAQDLNRLGQKTATLQHGHFHPNGFAFYASVCQYFLANSNYECYLAKKAEVHARYIIALGMGKYIGNEKETINNTYKKEKIGIVFDGDDYFENNVNMLEIVKEIAVKKGYHIYVKFHPTSKTLQYKSFIDDDYICVVDVNWAVEKFMEEVDFIVVANSTILLEAIFMLKPWYRYCNSAEDVFAGIDQNRFSTAKEFDKLIQKEVLFSEMMEIRDYVVGKGNPEKMYKNFFEKCILGLGEMEDNEEILQ